ncbi:MAG: hypothetical protein R3C39_12520 [Dehalococcoidia bacterium]
MTTHRTLATVPTARVGVETTTVQWPPARNTVVAVFDQTHQAIEARDIALAASPRGRARVIGGDELARGASRPASAAKRLAGRLSDEGGALAETLDVARGGFVLMVSDVDDQAVTARLTGLASARMIYRAGSWTNELIRRPA